MPFIKCTNPFDSLDLTAMHTAYQAACKELGFDKGDGDRDRRDRLAALIIELAQNGERDAELLKVRAVALLMAPA
jgi:hypothetical protein